MRRSTASGTRSSTSQRPETASPFAEEDSGASDTSTCLAQISFAFNCCPEISRDFCSSLKVCVGPCCPTCDQRADFLPEHTSSNDALNLVKVIKRAVLNP